MKQQRVIKSAEVHESRNGTPYLKMIAEDGKPIPVLWSHGELWDDIQVLGLSLKSILIRMITICGI